MNNVAKMSFGEMLGWTCRLSDVSAIKDKRLKKERLENLRNDFKSVHPIPGCQHTESMRETIDREYSLVADRIVQ